MTVVSNTSPLNYLILIGHADILSKLYGTTEQGLMSLSEALEGLKRTNFRVSPGVLESLTNQSR